MKNLRLVAHQFKYDARTYVRAPEALFFTAFLPLMFLVLFVGVFGNEDVPIGNGQHIAGATYFVPAILALTVVSSTAVNLGISIAVFRERGTLKRLRATPLPPAAFLAARVVTQVVSVSVISAIVIVFGQVVYNVSVPASAWPSLLVALVVGIASFCCVGFLLTLILRTEQSAPAVTNAIVLPLQFMSGVFFPRGSIPVWMRDIARIFPIEHLVDLFFDIFDPNHTGSRLSSTHLLVLGAWAIGSLIVAARFFRWTPTNR